MTVSWPFGAVPWLPLGCGCGPSRVGDGAGKLRNRAQHLAPMTERDAEVLEILVRQIAESADLKVVLNKALRVLGHAELFQPVYNSLPCGHQGPLWPNRGLDLGERSLHQYVY